MTSLRGKITTSYGLSKVALLIFVAVVIADLHYLQTQIVEGEAVNDFFTATQEIRFAEKNLFLYHNEQDIEKLHKQLDLARNIFNEGRRVFSEIASAQELKQVETLLIKYRTQLSEYAGMSDQTRHQGESAIRISGHALSELIRDFNRRERIVLTDTTRVAARTLMIASLTVILIGIASAIFMVRRIVRPIRELEKHYTAYTSKADLKNIDTANQSQRKLAEYFQPFFASIHEMLKLIDRKVRKLDKEHGGNKEVKTVKTQLDELHKEIKDSEYFFTHINWLQERFPDAKYEDVTGLCKLAAPDEVKEQDYSLNPGRYVGVVIEEDGKTEEEFVEEILSLNNKLLELNSEAQFLEKVINFNVEKMINGQ